ncbi:MAG: carbonic anhydrase [Dehalococcoidia bacterium]|nr:carbonic anhydrase [Dehalococcoidia bacterium]
MSAIDRALAANRYFAETFELPPRMPNPELAAVLCMDARIDPIRTLGLHPGEGHIIRNAGGRLSDAIRSLAISQTILGTREVAIVHHTECGMMRYSDDEMRMMFRKATGAIADGIAFLPFHDLEQSVRDDLELYRQSTLLRQDIPVRGFIYDVETGRLTEVE